MNIIAYSRALVRATFPGVNTYIRGVLKYTTEFTARDYNMSTHSGPPTCIDSLGCLVDTKFGSNHDKNLKLKLYLFHGSSIAASYIV